jgi:Uma2 family endonuclease
MVAESRPARMTLEEYRAFERTADRKHEFFAGYVYAMAGGSRRHAALGRRIATLLAEAVGEGPCEVYNSDMRVRLSDQVQVYPDASVTCDERDRENDEEHEIAYPCLVVEVLSRTTERIDRGRKLRDYQACHSIEEFVLINTEYRAVEVYRRSGATWSYDRYEADDVVELTSIGARIPLAVLYARTAVPHAPLE